MSSRVKATLVGLVLCIGGMVIGGIGVEKIMASSAQYRQCDLGTSCVIGEYLYDDEYTPITTATCTFTSIAPNGDPFVDEEMLPGGDGWYYYPVVTTGETEGLYRSEMCCTTVELDYLCLDKTFMISADSNLSVTDVENAVWDAARTDHNTADTFGENLQNPSSVTAGEVADAVWEEPTTDHNTADTFGENLQNPSSLSASDIWNYPNRSLSSFGNLISDIWGYSSRSVNSFSSLVSGIWTHSERKLTTPVTNNGTIATQTTASLEDISDQLAENRKLLEKLANQPVIKTVVEEGQTEASQGDLQTKIESTKLIAQQLSSTTAELRASIRSISSGWQQSSLQSFMDKMTGLSQVLGTNSEDDADPGSLASRISWLNKSWSSPIISSLADQATSVMANASVISRDLKTFGKSQTSQTYLLLADAHLKNLEKLLGKEKDNADTPTLYGYLSYLEGAGRSWTTYGNDLDQLLANWGSYEKRTLDGKLAQLKHDIIQLNRIKNGERALVTDIQDKDYRQNLALGLRAIVDSNIALLAQDVDVPVKTYWLENGSIIFKSLVTNPSSLISQKVPVKYYLPGEISQEQVIKVDEGLTIEYDPQEDSLYVSGEFNLRPEETKTFMVEVEDVWVVPNEEIASIRKQSETLFAPLKDTAYFAQGATLKADIEVDLDNAQLLLKKGQTPESRIMSYRQAMVELNSAKTKLDNLKTLASSAGSIGTVFGFVGGVQTLAVWGLIIVLIAGFVFLALYLKMISTSNGSSIWNMSKKSTHKIKPEAKKKATAKHNTDPVTQILAKLQLKPKDETISIKVTKSVLLKLGMVALAGLIALILSIWALSRRQIVMMAPLPDGRSQEELFAFEKGMPAGVVVTQQKPPGMVSSVGEKLAAEENGRTERVMGFAVPTQTPDLLPLTLVVVEVPPGAQSVNVRAAPSLESEIITRLWVTKKAYIIDETAEWVKVEIPSQVIGSNPLAGWVHREFIQAE